VSTPSKTSFLTQLMELLLILCGVGLFKHAKRRVRRGKHYSNDEF
jgi:hypothetical protein